MGLGRRKSCFEMATRALIPLRPVAMRDVKILYPPPKERASGQDAQPLEEAGELVLTAGLKFCCFWISDAIGFPLVIKRDA